MNSADDKNHKNHLTRRTFLSAAALATTAPATRLVAEASRDGRALRLRPGQTRARVVQVQSPQVVENRAVHATLLDEMIAASLKSLTGRATSQESWRALFRSDDVIGIKFNRSAQAILGTTRIVATVLVKSLVEAGFRADQIVCIEAPEEVSIRLGTTRPVSGYSSTATNFDSGADNLALVLDQVSALINVPFLKTHNIAGMTACLKNLSHGLIKHPARYHANGCSPFVADIVAVPKIRKKLRLCIVDGLRTMYAGGPAATGASIGEEGIIIAATDPVACDAVCLQALNEVRARVGLPPVAPSPGDIPYLAVAHRRGLGVAVSHGIDLIRLTP